jgi:hypothetical protein
MGTVPMRLWKWLLEKVHARPAIATRQAAARRWIAEEPLLKAIHRLLEVGTTNWNSDWPIWRRNVAVLKRIAAAAQSRNTLELWEDEHVRGWLAEYVSKLRLKLGDASAKAPGQDWATTQLKVYPTWRDGQEARAFETLDVFWQMVFASMFYGTRPFPPVCQLCGTDLPSLTPRGRESRRTICAKCSTRQRRREMSDEDRRKENRRYQRDRRRRLAEAREPQA